MELMQLPSEILLNIFSNLDAQFFSCNMGRLTLSKRWYEFARPIVARLLLLDSRSLPRFFDLVANEDSFTKIRELVDSLKLSVQGLYSYRPSHGWVQTETSSRLDALAAVLQECRNLHHVCIVVSLEAWGQVPAVPIGSLVGSHHLTTLELDLPSLDQRPRGQTWTHLCQDVSLLLPTLRRLRCRMFRICEEILQLPRNLDGKPLELEELVINFTRVHLTGPYQFPRPCSWHAPRNRERAFHVTAAIIERRAAKLASGLRNPKAVKIMSYHLSSGRINVFDALTRRRTWLEPHADWDACGEEE